MPNTTSAKKALRQSISRRGRNLKQKQLYKKEVKNIRKFLADKNPGSAATSLPKTFQAIDKAAKARIISKNKASRLKSRLAAAIAKTKS